MSLTKGALKLNTRKASPTPHMPIDTFFASLAEHQREGSIGVLLSGTAHDGTAGLKAIKSAGGLPLHKTILHYSKVCRSLLSPKDWLTRYYRQKEIADELARIGSKREVIEEVMAAPAEADLNDEDLIAIIQLLKKSTGVDFKHYKVNTIKRRVIRRMLLYKLETLKEYTTYLKQHAHEINVLYQDLLINVTAFFRDADSLEYLRKGIIPKIIKSKQPSDPIRVWIPACSTGEEAYSMAITWLRF